MTKPLNKGGTEKPPIPTIKLPPGIQYQTRAVAQAASTTKEASTQSRSTIAQPKEAKENTAENSKEEAPDNDKQEPTTLQTISKAINVIIEKAKLEKKVKTLLEVLVKFIRDMEEKEKKRAGNIARQSEVSILHKAIKQDLAKLHEVLAKQIDGILDTASVTLKTTEKVLSGVQELKEENKEIVNRVGKVNDAADKIADTTQSYRDALAKSPAVNNRSNLDPKVLGDMERKAHQILIDVYDDEDNNILSKSLTEIIAKANTAIGKIGDGDKPAEIHVETVLQTRKGALVLTLNSREAVSWLRSPEHEMAFTEEFSKGSHIRERSYNLIAPRVPITFEPENKEHLREIEVVNSLDEHLIRKARWIKPTARRRVGQTHAYAILTVTSAEDANILIRDGLIMFGARVRPTKQKAEPIQCMKCRRWGHFAGECQASEDTCGTCAGQHRTNVCHKRDFPRCVTCETTDHASWDRNCPEFIRRCYLVDERNPENSMQYFPTEQDWTQAVRSDRIPLDERFPGKFAVNNLPINGSRQGWQAEAGPRKGKGRGSAPPLRNGPNRGSGPTEKAIHTFPNSIPINKDIRQPTGKPDENEAQDPYDQPGWLEEIKEQLTRVTNSEGHNALGAPSQT